MTVTDSAQLVGRFDFYNPPQYTHPALKSTGISNVVIPRKTDVLLRNPPYPEKVANGCPARPRVFAFSLSPSPQLSAFPFML